MSPKVKILSQGLAENCYSVGNKRWAASTLVQYCKEKGYPIFKLPLAGINLSDMPFDVNNLDEFIFQCNRVNKADLKYPILIDSIGRICDGYHRVVKAIIEGKTEIDAIRIEEMPSPDGYEHE